ncbi:Chromatin assembly factor 1 subunit rlf2 [Penicillium subrubescens]|uniref:Chromatin assembly factor 1 subunit rlf2 n=2 Tax=Penicillium subrubescens TaxID=1316194 RepID=A0A1Q5TLB5_9EURO|nr:Chromatin assembly factor 1 subunit rlf2 [Penicillium subrubescens]
MSGSKETTPCCVSSSDEPLPPPTSSSPKKSESASTPAGKKRKLSPASQDAKQQEKEARERQKLEEKAKKEEEKRIKAEEKKKRDEEREEEKRLKEEEKKKREAEREEKRKAKDEEKAAKEAAKEEEKKRKEEEKLKKERAQLKLNSFFVKPSLPSKSTGPAPSTFTSPKKPTPTTSELPLTNSPKSNKSDYERTFPEFFLQSHTQLAPSHRFERDPEALTHVRQKLDATLNATQTTSHPDLPFRPSEIFHLIPFHRRCGRPRQSVKEILLRIQNSSDDSLMELDSKDQIKAAEDARDILRQIPMKTLRFSEDVRPPYQGTFTRPVPELSARRLARNPWHRGLPEVNYDYDSEAEWEEPEEGEDLDSEEDEEGSDDGDDDMDGFLDDDDDALLGGKRRLIVGDLEPVSSGLRWAADGVDDDMKAYQAETISDGVKFPIDPFSTAYWEKPKPKPAEPAPTQTRIAPANTNTLDVFRVTTPSGALAVAPAKPPATGKAKRPFPPEQLSEFRQAVEASDLSKIGTVEILKKKFPKVPKDTLKATLDQYAVRVGQKESEKKWVWR